MPFPKILCASFVMCFLAIGLNAQQAEPQQGGGGGQPNQTPQPAPQPTPQPRQPGNPTPQPTFPTEGSIAIRGRIIADTHNSFPQIEVRLETDGGPPVGFAYTDSSGEFYFQRTGLRLDSNLYVTVKMDGYKPYRERVEGIFDTNNFQSSVTIFLEREDVITVPKNGAAVVDLKQLRAKIPGKAVDEYEKALKESLKGNRGKAMEGIQRAIKMAPDFYEAQHSLGVQYFQMEKYDDAETALLRARDLSPKAPEVLMNLGSLYYRQGEGQSDAGHADEAASIFQKAVDVLEESIKRNPLSPAAHSYLGAALYKLASYERSESMLNRALEIDENQSDARLMLVNVYTRQARYDEALQSVNIFLTKNPKAPQRPALENIKAKIEKVLAEAK